MLGLTVRLVISLVIVVGLLLLLAKVGQKRFAGRAGTPIQVIHRQSLSRSSAVAVVAVGSRVLVLGTTDQQVRLLTELDPEELELLQPQAAVAGLGAPRDSAQDAADARKLLDDTLDESYDEVAARFNAVMPVTKTGGVIAPQSQGRLAGSALSPATWKQAFQAVSSLGGRSR